MSIDSTHFFKGILVDALEDSSLTFSKTHRLSIIIVFIVGFDHMWLNSKHHWQILEHLAFFVLVLLFVVHVYLIHQVWINSSKCANEFEYQLSHVLNLL